MIPARPHSPPAPEAGFILIEVLISALLIAITAGAVLGLISATTRSAANQRAHSVAYAVGQEDQARLRSMRISSLNRLDQENPVEVDGVRYMVRSQGVFVSNATGSVSCTGEVSPADYVQITSTVSGGDMEKPVSLASIVAPSNGSLDPTHGTLSVKAANAAGQPLAGVFINGSGTSTFSGSTDSTGCANFADLPSGNYSVTTSAGGMINMNGETSTTIERGVPSSGTQIVSLAYDQAGRLEPEFVYRVGSTTNFLPARADSIELYNSEGGTSTAKMYGTPGGTRTATVQAGTLFPFKAKYTVYGGGCETNNPDPAETLPANRPAMAFVNVPPGGTAKPQIQLPALNLTVTYNGSPISGARVTITDTNTGCKYLGNAIKRAYSTNASGQQIASTTEPVVEPGLPWGKYKVCASAKVKTTPTVEYRRIESSTVNVENLTSGTTLALSLSGTGSTSGSTISAACP